jgi:Predicted redox protein, regulator of disulfide bond formation
MSNLLEAKIQLLNEGVKFKSVVEGKPEVITDYLPPYGDGLSILPLELFLVSFGTCAGGVILPMLRRMGKQVKDFQISVKGKRRAEHPLCFEEINLIVTVTSEDIIEEDVKKVLNLAEEKYCPVWAMMKGNVKITHQVCIKK